MGFLVGENVRGAELSARFGLAPNSLSYCGGRDFPKVLAAYLAGKNRANEEALAASLRRFRAHYAYLRLIAKANGRKPFDREVAEALWIGNSLLSKVKKEDLAMLISREFSCRGLLPRGKAQAFARGIPGGALPHHSFHVLYIHTITGAVKPSLSTADSCRPGWGRVAKIGRGSLEVLSQKLVLKKNGLALAKCKKRLKRACAGMLLVPEIGKGDWVASHWGFAVMRLSQGQRRRLERTTLANLAALGGSHGLGRSKTRSGKPAGRFALRQPGKAGMP